MYRVGSAVYIILIDIESYLVIPASPGNPASPGFPFLPLDPGKPCKPANKSVTSSLCYAMQHSPSVIHRCNQLGVNCVASEMIDT